MAEATEGQAKLPHRPTRLDLTQSVSRYFTDFPAPGNTLDKIIADPSYWAHVSKDLTVGSEITLFAQDQSYWAKVLVVAVGPVWAKVATLIHVPLGGLQDAPLPLAFAIEWKGPKHKFAVVRTSDNAILKGEFATKDDATVWLSQHMKALAA